MTQVQIARPEHSTVRDTEIPCFFDSRFMDADPDDGEFLEARSYDGQGNYERIPEKVREESYNIV